MTQFNLSLKDGVVWFQTTVGPDAAGMTGIALIDGEDLAEAIALLSKMREEIEDSYRPNLSNAVVDVRAEDSYRPNLSNAVVDVRAGK